MWHKFLFKAGYFLKRPAVLRFYKEFQKTQWLPYEQLKEEQEKRLRRLVAFSCEDVSYYTKLFERLSLKPADIRTIEDLQKLPILTKAIIRANWENLIPKNISKLKYLNGSTGGSTGEPLKFRMSKEDHERGVSLLFRAWGCAGYRLGDKVAIIAGASLIPDTVSETKKKIQATFLNFRLYSTYGMSEETLLDYVKDVKKWRPKFLRGYASSIYLFAKFLRDNNMKLEYQPRAAITTAEKLFAPQRKIIEQALGTEVFDTYGLNDGGLAAAECDRHKGMHIATERAILEVVDDSGKQVQNQKGAILATSLYNYALPFIRYDTGDLGVISDSSCSCGREQLLLMEIVGRVTDSLKLNATSMGSPVITVLMGKLDIEQYQIVQNGHSSIVCRIRKGKEFNEEKDEDFIRRSFFAHVGKIEIKFDYVDSIQPPDGLKHKFIINEWNG